MNFSSVDAIRSAGFVGFSSVRDLQSLRCGGIPLESGVYLVLRDLKGHPHFAARSCGGRFKGKDPTVPIADLRRRWVDDAIVLYIGKAGGGRSRAALRRRLWDYVRFGAGEPVGHWGGRFIWQLEDCLELVICWRPSGEQDAAQLESELIRKFTETYGRRPFANLPN